MVLMRSGVNWISLITIKNNNLNQKMGMKKEGEVMRCSLTGFDAHFSPAVGGNVLLMRQYHGVFNEKDRWV